MNLFSFIKSKVPILEVVQEFSALKKAGNYWKGNCPFHLEKTASFTVSPHRDIFYCFGCHQGGDVIAFIATVERCSQLEAAQFLIDRYQLSVPQELLQVSSADGSNKKEYTQLCGLLAQWCHEKLLNNKSALTYLIQRNISKATIKKFMLGYLPANSLKSLGERLLKEGFLIQQLKDMQFALDGKHGLYSPFEERIIFPIFDHTGRPIAFGGRVFKPEDDRPKYYNSHENHYFAKGSILYGLHEAKSAIKEQKTVFLVEGYTDLIVMHQCGFTNTVATLGTACTQEHLLTLSRYGQRLYALYDGDKAGRQALIRLTKLCWQTSLELSVIILKEQEDPASYLAQGQSLQPLIDQAQDIFAFFLQEKSTDFHQKNLNERILLVDECLEAITQVEDPLKQNMLLQKASTLFSIPLEMLIKRIKTKKHPTAELVGPCPEYGSDLVIEKKLFSAILGTKNVFSPEDEQFLELYLPSPFNALFEKLQQYKTADGHYNVPSFFDELEPTQKHLIAQLMVSEEHEDQETGKKLFDQFQKKQWKLMVNDVKMELAQTKNTSQQELLRTKLIKLQELQKKLLQRGLI